jgi:hypothetical protein
LGVFSTLPHSLLLQWWALLVTSKLTHFLELLVEALLTFEYPRAPEDRSRRSSTSVDPNSNPNPNPGFSLSVRRKTLATTTKLVSSGSFLSVESKGNSEKSDSRGSSRQAQTGTTPPPSNKALQQGFLAHESACIVLDLLDLFVVHTRESLSLIQSSSTSNSLMERLCGVLVLLLQQRHSVSFFQHLCAFLRGFLLKVCVYFLCLE